MAKTQNCHISLDLSQIKKISSLSYLQLLMLKKRNCPYFLDQMTFQGDMSFFSFCGWSGVFRYSHETTKLPLLTRMNPGHENESTFTSSTFKVGENKVPLLFGSDFI